LSPELVGEKARIRGSGDELHPELIVETHHLEGERQLGAGEGEEKALGALGLHRFLPRQGDHALDEGLVGREALYLGSSICGSSGSGRGGAMRRPRKDGLCPSSLICGRKYPGKGT
jgi:hypothetical protein